MATAAWLMPKPRKALPLALFVWTAHPSTRRLGTRYGPQEKMHA